MHIVGLLEVAEGERKDRNIFTEKMALNFPTLGREKDIQINEGQRILLRRSTEKNNIETWYNHIVKHRRQRECWKHEEKSDLSLIRQLTYQRICQEKLCVQNGVWCIQSAKETKQNKNYQLWNWYSANLFFRNEGEINNFPDTQKLKEFVTTRFAL